MPRIETEMAPESFLRTQMIIFFAMVMGLTVTTVTFYLVGTVASPEADMAESPFDFFQYVVPIGAIIGILGGNYIFRKLVLAIPKTTYLKNRLAQYSQAMIVRYALYEGPGMLAAVAFFLTGNQLYLAVVAGIAFMLYTLRPSKDKTVMDLELGSEDAKRL